MMPENADLSGASAAETLRIRLGKIRGLHAEVRLVVEARVRGDRFAVAAAWQVIDQVRDLYPDARLMFDAAEG